MASNPAEYRNIRISALCLHASSGNLVEPTFVLADNYCLIEGGPVKAFFLNRSDLHSNPMVLAEPFFLNVFGVTSMSKYSHPDILFPAPPFTEKQESHLGPFIR